MLPVNFTENTLNIILSEETKIRKLFINIQKIAAVLIIGFGIFSGLLIYNYLNSSDYNNYHANNIEDEFDYFASNNFSDYEAFFYQSNN
jgi:hypothetical protein